ncbi:MAG TPA: hypothetical protein VJO33_08150 [Gemmatimonadaceae bacterium]|nr:hypothetical protein [Gemmatimonadaceae bacterium]
MIVTFLTLTSFGGYEEDDFAARGDTATDRFAAASAKTFHHTGRDDGAVRE